MFINKFLINFKNFNTHAFKKKKNIPSTYTENKQRSRVWSGIKEFKVRIMAVGGTRTRDMYVS